MLCWLLEVNAFGRILDELSILYSSIKDVDHEEVSRIRPRWRQASTNKLGVERGGHHTINPIQGHILELRSDMGSQQRVIDLAGTRLEIRLTL